MKLQSLIPVSTKNLLGPVALIGVCLVGTTPASAAFISFSEDPNGIAPIAVSTDIASANISTSIESASLSVGNVTGALRRILETLGIERLPTAPYLEAHVVGTPWSPISARLRAEAEAEGAAEAAKEGADAADVPAGHKIERTAAPASLRGQREGIS